MVPGELDAVDLRDLLSHLHASRTYYGSGKAHSPHLFPGVFSLFLRLQQRSQRFPGQGIWILPILPRSCLDWFGPCYPVCTEDGDFDQIVGVR